MVDRVDTGIGDNPKIIANRLSYDDDMAILQQGSVKSIKRFFQRVENSKSLDRDSFGSTSVSINRENVITRGDSRYVLEPGVSINSVGFVIKLIIAILILTILWNYLNSE